jgi:hypothetical protein
MAAENSVLRDVIDDHKLAAVADLIANRGFHPQFTAWRKTERNLVAHRAGDPAILGHPRHRRKTKARSAADDLKDRRHGIDFPNGRQIVSNTIFHGGSWPATTQCHLT